MGPIARRAGSPIWTVTLLFCYAWCSGADPEGGAVDIGGILETLPREGVEPVNVTDIYREVEEYVGQFVGKPGGVRHGSRPSTAAAFKRFNAYMETPSTKRNLVVVIGGDRFDSSGWVRPGEDRSWDLVLIYYDNDLNFSCPLCTKMYWAKGAKWNLAWRLTLSPDWHRFKRQYSAIAFLDDDLRMDGARVLNTAFAATHAFDLVIAQPSVCPLRGSFTPYRPLYQIDGNLLHYTTMVEVMSPIFLMDTFDRFIRPTLYNGFYGWGLDWVWPQLLGYPENRIAVIDQECIYHPKVDRAKSMLYQIVAPVNPKEEANLRLMEWGFDANAKPGQMHSTPHRSCQVISTVPLPSRGLGKLRIFGGVGSPFERQGIAVPPTPAGDHFAWLLGSTHLKTLQATRLVLAYVVVPLNLLGAAVVLMVVYWRKSRWPRVKPAAGGTTVDAD